MKASILGKWSISQSSIFDGHIFLMLIPAAFLLFAYITRNSSRNISNGRKNAISTLIGLVFIVSFALTLIETLTYNNEELTGLNAFSNIDMFISLIVGVSFLSKRLSIARASIPATIVLGMTRLINNPGEDLTIVEALNSILLITLPIYSIIFTRKTISIKGFSVVTLINISLLVYISFVNNAAGTEFMTLTKQGLNKNFFYALFNELEFKSFMFIFVSIFFETLIWLFIRYVFWKQNETALHSFKRSLINEYLVQKHTAKLTGKRIYSISQSSFEVEQFNDEALNNVELSAGEDSIDMFEHLEFKRSDEVVLIPHQLIRNRNSKGTRAPSL